MINYKMDLFDLIIYVPVSIFSSPEPKARDELIVWDSSPCLSVRVSAHPHFQR